MKVVALVPIKLNSQRLPHKNILPIAGKPLCFHIVDTLIKCNNIDEVYVYCSDEKVTEYIPQKAIFLKRDKKLDGDNIKGFDIYRSFINQIDADIYVLAHTTSPFIKQLSIENAVSKVVNNDYDSAFSAERIQTFAWYENKPINYDITDVPRTQDMEPIWVETSAFYVFNKNIFVKNNRRIGFNPYIQEVSGLEAIDIDEKKDYELATKLSDVENENEKN